MLPRISIRKTLSSVGLWKRLSSSDSTSLYSPKVRALPFAISATEAVTSLGVSAALLNGAFPSSTLSSIAAYYAPSLGFTPYQPTRIQPLYVPGWFLDAEVTAKLWLGEDGPHEAVATFQNSYVPGFSFRPLSETPFGSEEIIPSKAVPFSKELLNQHGSDITCLPYTFSPLSLVDAVHSLPPRDVTFDGIRFDPISVQASIVAAFPVLVPIYLVQYKSEAFEQHSTFVLEAFSRNGRCRFNRSILENYPTGLDSLFNQKEHRPESELLLWRGEHTPFVRMESLFPMIRAKASLEERLEDLVETKLHSGSLNNSVNMEDLRVREFTNAEVDPIRLWMKVDIDLASTKNLLEKLSSGQGKASGIAIGASGIKSIGRNQMVTTVTERVESLTKARGELKPIWLKNWEDSRK